MDINEKLDLIIKNQDILNKNQILIFNQLVDIETTVERSDKNAFRKNYLADLAGTATAELGLVDILKTIKNK